MTVVTQLLAAVGTLTAVVLLVLTAAVTLLIDLPQRPTAVDACTVGNLFGFLLTRWWPVLYVHPGRTSTPPPVVWSAPAGAVRI